MLILACILIALGIGLSLFGLTYALIRWPLPIVGALLGTAAYHWRQRKQLQQDPTEKDFDSASFFWATGFAALGFILSQLSNPVTDFALLLVGALGLGGAAGLYTWLIVSMTSAALRVIFSSWRLLRDDDFKGAP